MVRSNVPPFGTMGQAMIVDQVYWTRTDTKQGVAIVGGLTQAVTPSAWAFETVTFDAEAFAVGGPVDLRDDCRLGLCGRRRLVDRVRLGSGARAVFDSDLEANARAMSPAV